jgi:hypothetical protein
MSVQQNDRDRRLEPRLADEGVVHVEYIAPSPHVRDLSASGVYLADPRQLQLGQTVKLRLSLGAAGTPIVVTGMVRRVDPGQGFAVEFIQLAQGDRRRLKEFIARGNPDKISAAGADGLG